jgi:hypothetical protein
MPVETKLCPDCTESFPIANFGRTSQGYPHTQCPDCRRARARQRYADQREAERERVFAKSLRRRYGMTLEEYYERLAAQDSRCAICDEEPEDRMQVDHCHTTGAVRSLLCSGCNSMLGRARDRPEVLRKGATYLEQHSPMNMARR